MQLRRKTPISGWKRQKSATGTSGAKHGATASTEANMTRIDIKTFALSTIGTLVLSTTCVLAAIGPLPAAPAVAAVPQTK